MTDAELAILSIIAEAPITGYNIQSVIDKRDLRAWTMIGVESVYYVIDKLERQGLIEPAKKAHRSNPRNQQYRITSAGIGVLQTAVTDMLSSPRLAPTSFDIGLANLNVLKTEQARHALYGYRAGLEQRLESISRRLRHLMEKTTPPFHIIAMFEHQLMLIDAEMQWFDKWFTTWEAQAPPDEEPEPMPVKEIPRHQQVILPHDPDSFHKHPTLEHKRPEESDDPDNTPDTTEVNRGTKRIALDDEEEITQ